MVEDDPRVMTLAGIALRALIEPPNAMGRHYHNRELGGGHHLSDALRRSIVVGLAMPVGRAVLQSVPMHGAGISESPQTIGAARRQLRSRRKAG